MIRPRLGSCRSRCCGQPNGFRTTYVHRELPGEETVLIPATWRRTSRLRGAKAANLHVSPILGD
ncbi:hypothetical protein FXF51_52150 [Nonomuraea sp. PA05]|uniref:hypothetical protein n=1 Tax=Nonomuraea sp. PA05 TaxID=2604466 RepID=UPI0011D6B04E|nr:hypothetical protein [Nonomuraea sp. PA05]TYB51937.1 hypothetical protein FXF51_52150 [Nonomuraea sp. PA05]